MEVLLSFFCDRVSSNAMHVIDIGKSGKVDRSPENLYGGGVLLILHMV